jgi:beta-xylosidase
MESFPTVSSSCLTRNRRKDTDFTGTFLGIFAQGTQGSPARQVAYFRDFKVENFDP